MHGVRSRAVAPDCVAEMAKRWKFSSPPSSWRNRSVWLSSAQKYLPPETQFNASQEQDGL